MEEFAWLKAFDKEELLQFLEEVLRAKESEQRDAVIHEWHESAIALEMGFTPEDDQSR